MHKIHAIFGKWRIVIYHNQASKAPAIRVDSPSGLSDYPIQYDDGTIGYIRPNMIPVAVKREVAMLYKPRRRTIATLADYQGIV